MLECFIDIHTESEKHARVTAARWGTVNEARHMYLSTKVVA